MITEPLTWHVLADNPADLPDADITVLIELDPACDYSEPVFMGSWDGEVWRDVHGVEVQVIAWADVPMGTAGVAPARQLSADEAAAVKFYTDNPSAALFDLRRRIDGPVGVAPAPTSLVTLDDLNMLALSSEALDEASGAHDRDGNNSTAESCRARAFELREFGRKLYPAVAGVQASQPRPSVDDLMHLAMTMASLFRNAPASLPGNCLAEYDKTKAKLRTELERALGVSVPGGQTFSPADADGPAGAGQ